MGRKTISVLLVSLALWPIPRAEAQQASQTARIGILQSGSASSSMSRIAALRDGLRELVIWKVRT
jgi:hypothetical protein